MNNDGDVDTDEDNCDLDYRAAGNLILKTTKAKVYLQHNDDDDFSSPPPPLSSLFPSLALREYSLLSLIAGSSAVAELVSRSRVLSLHYQIVLILSTTTYSFVRTRTIYTRLHLIMNFIVLGEMPYVSFVTFNSRRIKILSNFI
ncbi:hypothetical protein ALC62_01647 [Cyphomyrmex costatus]|uniref:Uncharacterized protein n=1 Tax=Cyphomyrmex costatus TaxID=456900 RepID=A0A195D3F9_9HYME|nr:hypothetical protein ALC62_01647 [Cyphomyrmex costatus]